MIAQTKGIVAIPYSSSFNNADILSVLRWELPSSVALCSQLQQGRMVLSPRERLAQMCIQYASIALIYYDYLLTFPAEVRYIWGQRFRLSTLLYIFCRYALVANIVYLMSITGHLSTDCDVGYIVSSSLSILARACVLIVGITRTYAVYDASRVILIVFGTLGVACVCIDMLHVPTVRCNGVAHSPFQMMSSILAVMVVILEFSLTVLTSLRCIQTLRSFGDWTSQKNSLNYQILRQTLLYFGTVFGFALTALIFDLTAIAGSFIQKLINALNLPVAGLMTARFFLHLREWKETSENGTINPVSTATMVFAPGPSLATLDDFRDYPFSYPGLRSTAAVSEV